MERTLRILVTWDQRVFWMVHNRFKCTLFDRIFPWVSKVGSTEATVFCAMVLFLCDYEIGVKLVYNQGLQTAIGLWITHIIIQQIKYFTGRQRPSDVLDRVHGFPLNLRDYSFPSEHTAAIVTITVSLWPLIPELGFFLGGIAVLVGISRIYLGAHYPTDVLAGALIGGFTGFILLQI